MPMLWVELKWGPMWREERRVRMDQKKEDQQRTHEMEESNSSSAQSTEGPEETMPQAGEKEKN
jgi:hypothetical protein